MESIRTILAGPAARLLALWHINDVELALARRQLQDDAAAVAQLHTALRRLQEVLRTYGSELKSSVSKKHVRQLAVLAREAHDGVREHAAGTLMDQFDLSEDEVEQAKKVTDRLAKRKSAALRSIDKIPDEFAELSKRWRASLATYRLKLDPDAIPLFEVFTTVALRQIRRAANRLEQALASIGDVDGDEALAKARRSAERLLHVIEPMRTALSTMTDVAKASQQLITLLDAIQATNELRATIAATGLDPAARIHELIEQKRVHLFYDLRRVWLEGNSKWFFQRLQQTFETTSRMEVVRSGHRRVSAPAENPSPVPSRA